MDENNSENIIEGEKDNSNKEGNLDEDKPMSVDTQKQKHTMFRDRENINKAIIYRNAVYSS